MAAFDSVGSARRGHRRVRRHHGDQPGAELTRIFFQDIRVQGVTMGTREDFGRLLRFVEHADLHPVIDHVYDFDHAAEAFARMRDGDVFGNIVLRP